ncbi:Heat shock 70 kDa 12B-like protein [Cladobotryum mycophilum]|uniref:Heat shock 70 kDa 12B-like protein n=1 Tax=Cladobotryum mycophilum TaxID=491253 RepID=A0ABR0SV56_9HYPO
MPSITERTKLIVGIDYGTTYSGLSFAFSNAADFKDILPWTKYPGAFSHSAEHCVKAPTRVAFKDENSELDENAWGYQVEPGMKTYAWTKLLLDNTLPTDYDDPDLYLSAGSELMRLPKGKSAKDVVTEYLKGMKQMFDSAAAEYAGAHSLDDLPIDFWLTVPASWSERAKLLTKKAAMDAGFGTRSIDRIMLISEPEAAAHLSLKSSLHRLETFVKPKTGVMVCDCGGGTVDITTYEIENTEPTLKLRETAVGIAGKCGGTFVDRNLFKLLEKRFGEAFTSLGSEQIGPGSPFMDTFEGKKKDFSLNSPSRRVHRLILPMPQLKITPAIERFYERRSSSVLLTQEDYKSLFDPVIDLIIKLVEEQVAQIKRKKERSIETIVLVGGFGSSPYLKERLTEWSNLKGIRLTTPASGATKRVIWTDMWTNTQYLSGFTFWEIQKGTIIDKKTEINSGFEHTQTNYIQQTGTHTLYACSLDEAPTTIENKRLEVVGTVIYSLHGMDLTKVESRMINGSIQYKLKLTLNIRLDDEVGHLVFRVLYDGKEVGKAELDLGDA